MNLWGQNACIWYHKWYHSGMSKREKLIQKIFSKGQVSYDEIKALLEYFGYTVDVDGTSHAIFRKEGFEHLSVKKRSQLLPYQLELIQEALRKHGYEE